jgi:hypothetical protein
MLALFVLPFELITFSSVVHFLTFCSSPLPSHKAHFQYWDLVFLLSAHCSIVSLLHSFSDEYSIASVYLVTHVQLPSSIGSFPCFFH